MVLEYVSSCSLDVLAGRELIGQLAVGGEDILPTGSRALAIISLGNPIDEDVWDLITHRRASVAVKISLGGVRLVLILTILLKNV